MYSDTESYYDAKKNLRRPGDSYYDYRDYYRSPGESFYDSKGILRLDQEIFYDKKGISRLAGESFYDGKGILRSGRNQDSIRLGGYGGGSCGKGRISPKLINVGKKKWLAILLAVWCPVPIVWLLYTWRKDKYLFIGGMAFIILTAEYGIFLLWPLTIVIMAVRKKEWYENYWKTEWEKQEASSKKIVKN